MAETINSLTLGQEQSVYYVSFEQWKYISGLIKNAVATDNPLGSVTITPADWNNYFATEITAGTAFPISDNLIVSRLSNFRIKPVSVINASTIAEENVPVNAAAVSNYVSAHTNYNFVVSDKIMLFNNGTVSINSFCSPEGRLTFTQDTTDPTKIKIEVVSPKVETLV